MMGCRARGRPKRAGGQTLAAKQLPKTLCRNLVFSNAVRLCVTVFCALVWSVFGLFLTEIIGHRTFARGVETTAGVGNVVQQVFSNTNRGSTRIHCRSHSGIWYVWLCESGTVSLQDQNG